MQIRRTEGLLFPSFKTNAVTSNKILSVTKMVKENTAATVMISKEGRAKARMLDESSKNDDYMKHAEKKIDNILRS